MPKFKIYAGLGGGFGGAQFHGIYEYDTPEEADVDARQLCVEEYESYGGYHGLYTWDSMRQEIADNEYDGDIEQVDPEDVDIALTEEMEGWFAYKVIQVPDDTPLDCDDCFCD